MKWNGVLTSFSFLLLLTSCLFTSFDILSGARHTGILRKFHWLQADTNGFNGAPPTTRWYNYNWCDYNERFDRLGRCSGNKAGMEFSPRDNFNNANNIPATFRNSRNTYYYLSRIGWVALLLGFLFMLLALVPAIVSIFTERAHIISAFPLWIALFWLALAACLLTACCVKARNGFLNAGRRASLGKRSIGFLWSSVILLGLNCLWSTFAGALKFITDYRGRNANASYSKQPVEYYNNNAGFQNGVAYQGNKKPLFNGPQQKSAVRNGEVFSRGNDASELGPRFDKNAAYGTYNTDAITEPNSKAYKSTDKNLRTQTNFEPSNTTIPAQNVASYPADKQPTGYTGNVESTAYETSADVSHSVKDSAFYNYNSPVKNYNTPTADYNTLHTSKPSYNSSTIPKANVPATTPSLSQNVESKYTSNPSSNVNPSFGGVIPDTSPTKNSNITQTPKSHISSPNPIYSTTDPRVSHTSPSHSAKNSYVDPANVPSTYKTNAAPYPKNTHVSPNSKQQYYFTQAPTSSS